MKNLKSISLGIAMLISVLTFGQQKTITGIVTDFSGPLPGVNVTVKGTQRGVATNFDGTYKIQAKVGEKLVYSFMGMNDEIRIIGASNVINVKMKDDAKQLSEVVVTTGYSSDYESEERPTSSRRERKKAESNQTLSGQVYGVQVNSNSNVILRGNRSFSEKKR